MKMKALVLLLASPFLVSCSRTEAPAPGATAAKEKAAAITLTPAPAGPAAPIDLGPEPPRGKHLALFYSSNLQGEYEPCG